MIPTTTSDLINVNPADLAAVSATGDPSARRDRSRSQRLIGLPRVGKGMKRHVPAIMRRGGVGPLDRRRPCRPLSASKFKPVLVL